MSLFCGGDLHRAVRVVNLMFQTDDRPVQKDADGFLRPKTAQGIFWYFKTDAELRGSRSASRRIASPSQRDRRRELHLPHALVRADGAWSSSSPTRRTAVVRVLVRGAAGLYTRLGHLAREPAAPGHRRGSAPASQRDQRRRGTSTRARARLQGVANRGNFICDARLRIQRQEPEQQLPADRPRATSTPTAAACLGQRRRRCCATPTTRTRSWRRSARCCWPHQRFGEAAVLPLLRKTGTWKGARTTWNCASGCRPSTTRRQHRQRDRARTKIRAAYAATIGTTQMLEDGTVTLRDANCSQERIPVEGIVDVLEGRVDETAPAQGRRGIRYVCRGRKAHRRIYAAPQVLYWRRLEIDFTEDCWSGTR